MVAQADITDRPRKAAQSIRSGPRAAIHSQDHAARLRRLQRLSTLLDSSFRVPGIGFRFGLDSLVGLVPAVGDAAMAGLSLYLVYEASRLGISKRTLARMLGNVAADFAVGSVPLAGDAFDFFFKANSRNMRLLKKELEKRAQNV